MPREFEDRGDRLQGKGGYISGIGPSDAFWNRAEAGVSDLSFSCPWALRISGVLGRRVANIEMQGRHGDRDLDDLRSRIEGLADCVYTEIC
jgi:hypothetical protein